MVNSLLHRASFHLLPGRCLLCLAHTLAAADICTGCHDELPWLGPHCQRCALPLGSASRHGQCGQCLKSPPQFDECAAVWEYSYPVDQLISRFKYQRRQLYGSLLSRLALDRIRAASRPDLLAPVPMHWRRRLQRGFNQADIIARVWSPLLGIPVSTDLYRLQYNPPQQGLSAKQRRYNLQAAFALRKNADIAGKHVAIIDDVVTTAATANSVAAILREAGARRVSVWCLARTP